MSTWYYARGDQRLGPVDVSEIRALAAQGELNGDDLVWTDGMADWAPARTRRELGLDVTGNSDWPQPAPATVAPMQAVSPFPAQAVGYYVPTGGMPPRAAPHLDGHAGPTGDVGDWPLDDTRVATFVETMKLRRKVTGAAQLYRTLFLVGLIFTALLLLLVPFMMMAVPRGRSTDTLQMTVGAAFTVGQTIFCFFAWRATLKTRRWAPLTMGIIFLASIGWVVVSLLVASSASNQPGEAVGMLLGGVLLCIFPAIFAVTSFRAFSTIPRYLAQPAWCQEIIAASKL